MYLQSTVNEYDKFNMIYTNKIMSQHLKTKNKKLKQFE
jgi:hypothetical protein